MWPPNEHSFRIYHRDQHTHSYKTFAQALDRETRGKPARSGTPCPGPPAGLARAAVPRSRIAQTSSQGPAHTLTQDACRATRPGNARETRKIRDPLPQPDAVGAALQPPDQSLLKLHRRSQRTHSRKTHAEARGRETRGKPARSGTPRPTPPRSGPRCSPAITYHSNFVTGASAHTHARRMQRHEAGKRAASPQHREVPCVGPTRTGPRCSPPQVEIAKSRVIILPMKMSNCQAFAQDVERLCSSQQADPAKILVMNLPQFLANAPTPAIPIAPCSVINHSGAKRCWTSASCRRRCGELVVQHIAPPTIGLHLGLAPQPNQRPATLITPVRSLSCNLGHLNLSWRSKSECQTRAHTSSGAPRQVQTGVTGRPVRPATCMK